MYNKFLWQASEDSLRHMGNRRFYDQMLQDAMYNQQYRVTDEIDVTTLKDYMQVLKSFKGNNLLNPFLTHFK